MNLKNKVIEPKASLKPPASNSTHLTSSQLKLKTSRVAWKLYQGPDHTRRGHAPRASVTKLEDKQRSKLKDPA